MKTTFKEVSLRLIASYDLVTFKHSQWYFWSFKNNEWEWALLRVHSSSDCSNATFFYSLLLSSLCVFSLDGVINIDYVQYTNPCSGYGRNLKSSTVSLRVLIFPFALLNETLWQSFSRSYSLFRHFITTVLTGDWLWLEFVTRKVPFFHRRSRLNELDFWIHRLSDVDSSRILFTSFEWIWERNVVHILWSKIWSNYSIIFLSHVTVQFMINFISLYLRLNPPDKPPIWNNINSAETFFC